MKVSLALSLFVFTFMSSPVHADWEVLQTIHWPGDTVFSGTTVGGLSGLHCENDFSKIYAVTDDRKVTSVYEIKPQVLQKKLNLKIQNQIRLQDSDVNQRRLIDAEGLILLPWGSFLFSSDGDYSQKPRRPVELVEFKLDGSFLRNLDVPKVFLPELAGLQTSGVQNNYGFEGLSISPKKDKFLAFTEASLKQEIQSRWSRMQVYSMAEAFRATVSSQFAYLREPSLKNPLKFQGGVSEVLWWKDSKALVLERYIDSSLKIQVQIFEFDFSNSRSVESLKNIPLELQSWGSKIEKMNLTKALEKQLLTVQNIEGVCEGPIVEGKRTLLVVSDNNFLKFSPTQWVWIKTDEEKFQ